MGKEDFYKVILYILNVVYALFGIASAATGIWFFVQLSDIVALRNSNHYLLDYRVYWPQVAPWLFIVLGLFIMFVAFCGWCGASRESRGMLAIYGLFLLIIVLLQAIAATLVFVFVDSEHTDRFIKDTVYDGYYNSQSNPEVFNAFSRIQRKLRCCGANDARDYRSWRNDLPITCCLEGSSWSSPWSSEDRRLSSSTYQTAGYTSGYSNSYSSYSGDYYSGVCDFTDKEANERLGCAKVASVYSKIVSSSVAGVSLLMIIAEIVGLVLTYKLFNAVDEDDHYITEKKEGETEC